MLLKTIVFHHSNKLDLRQNRNDTVLISRKEITEARKKSLLNRTRIRHSCLDCNDEGAAAPHSFSSLLRKSQRPPRPAAGRRGQDSAERHRQPQPPGRAWRLQRGRAHRHGHADRQGGGVQRAQGGVQEGYEGVRAVFIRC